MDPIVIAALIWSAAWLTPQLLVSYLQARAVGKALKDMTVPGAETPTESPYL